jgi:hypothetical protein
MYAADKDFVHHVEVTDLAVPILVVTCKREELPGDIPELFRIEPVTPSLFDIERAPRVKKEKPPEAPVQFHSNIDPNELARAMVLLQMMQATPATPVEMPSPTRQPTPDELAAKLFSSF